MGAAGQEDFREEGRSVGKKRVREAGLSCGHNGQKESWGPVLSMVSRVKVSVGCTRRRSELEEGGGGEGRRKEGRRKEERRKDHTAS